MYQNLFSKTGLSLERLRTLLEVANAGSIVRAVDGDPTRQSQYSRQLKELEDFFGVELTRREGRNLVLTPAGKRLATLTRESFVQFSEFTSDCTDEPVQMNVGAGSGLIQWLILPRIGLLQKAFPKIRFLIKNLRTAEIVAQLSDFRLDFGLVHKKAVPSTLTAKPAGRMEYALFLSKQMEKMKWENILQELPIANLDTPGDFLQQIQVLATKAKVHINTKLQCGSFPNICQALLSGNYAAFLPRIAKVDLPDTQFAEIASPLFKNLSRDICLVWNPRIVRMRPIAGNLAVWMEKNWRIKG